MMHKDLDVWKKSIDFVTIVYKQTNSFPKEEIYGLTSQIRRGAISIPSNIAEGAARRNKTEFRQFLHIALASAAEIETQLIISVNLNYIPQDIQLELTSELTIISKMLQGLIKSLDIQN
jgi:four helix bundle protein